MVATTTGTGWVEPSASSSFEYLNDGDSAIVAMQYSHLPSWMSYLVDHTAARVAGRDLFDAVYDHWSRLPADHRPKLYVFGESLGSFGGENAFSGETDLANRTDGVLFVGPPSFNPLYREFVDSRDSGQPGDRAGLPRRPDDPLRQPGEREHPARGPAVDGHAGALPPAAVGPDHLVEPRPVVAPAGLARPRNAGPTSRTRCGGSRW